MTESQSITLARLARSAEGAVLVAYLQEMHRSTSKALEGLNDYQALLVKQGEARAYTSLLKQLELLKDS